MQQPDTATLTNLAAVWPKVTPSSPCAPGHAHDRLFSIWEITTWILPMAAEHLRRVLRQTPGLPQGQTDAEGGSRWFSFTDVADLRSHFAAVQDRTTGSRKTYIPRRPTGARAPLIVLAAPLGKAGRTTMTLHLAVAAALAGYKVLVIDADPAGRVADVLGAVSPGGTLLPLIARSCGQYLRQINSDRLDRGEAPLAMDDTIAAALDADPANLTRPSRWPGLDVIAAAPDLALADMQINTWTQTLRGWSPARALAHGLDTVNLHSRLAQGLDTANLRSRYDLILCDCGAGLGSLVMAVLMSADVLLVPWGDGDAGLTPLAQAMATRQLETTMTARALGRPAPAVGWRRLCLLATRGGRLPLPLTGVTLLPHPLPEIPQVASGQVAQFYDLDYRDDGRSTYTPMRDACDAAWRGLAGILADLWAEDTKSDAR